MKKRFVLILFLLLVNICYGNNESSDLIQNIILENENFSLTEYLLELKNNELNEEKKYYKSIIIGDDKGNIYFSENTKNVSPIASITKLMTAIVTLDNVKKAKVSLNDEVIISEKASKIPYGVKLSKKTKYKLKDLMKAILIRSSNNAAFAIAEHVSGSQDEFVKLMNKKAKELGLKSTKFYTPHGLPPSYTNRGMDESSSEDIYKLSLYALNYPEIIEISSKNIDYINYGKLKLESTNKLLKEIDGVKGLKTGYHKAAGHNVVFYTERYGEKIFLVILGSNTNKNRDEIGRNIIKKTYSHLNQIKN